MERNLLKFIWQNSRLKQVWLLIVIVASMPLYFLTLELPTQIVNGPIQGEDRFGKRQGQTQERLLGAGSRKPRALDRPVDDLRGQFQRQEIKRHRGDDD
ncbi:MAG: hypothetical protein RIF44_10150, partial [Nitratireductor sp.]